VELRRQLEKLGGTQAKPPKDSQASTLAKGQAPSPSSIQAADPPGQAADPAAEKAGGGLPYPTIKSLPLLGAKYADFYRRAKIQETVFELLTEQYELAKVQEAKETPSVKVLDSAKIPEKKSFPPRLVIMFLGTFLVFALSVVWVLGSARWKEVDPQDPRKLFAQEVAGTLKARIPWASRNGAAGASEEKDSMNRDDGEGTLSGGSLNS
jgi:hypothetical protein